MAIDFNTPELRFAINTVRRACLVAQRIQSAMTVDHITKDDLSPVTVADFAAQAIVARDLSEAMPRDVLVGEETADELRSDGNSELVHRLTQFLGDTIPGATGEAICDWIDLGRGVPDGRFWTVDPIDGTKGYLRRDQYATALALVEDGTVRMGVLGCPNLAMDCRPANDGAGVLAVAVRAEGAYSAPFGGDDFTKLAVSSQTDLAQARLLRSFESGHTNVDQMSELAEALGMKAEPVKMDSQAKYAVLAAGNGEVLCRLLSPSRPDYEEKIWDQAAGSIIVEEAGGKVTDLEGKPLDFSQGRTLANNRGVLATNGKLHDAVLNALQRVGA